MCIYTFMNISTFAALADPMRLALVEALRDGEQPVNELVERVRIQQSGVSRHLGILSRAGLVEVRPEGQQRFYSLRASSRSTSSTNGSHAFARTGKPASIDSAPRLQRRKTARTPRKKRSTK